MIFKTKVLGGGGYKVAKNDSITPQNNKDNCRNLQDNCNFLQNVQKTKINKNCSKLHNYKHQSNIKLNNTAAQNLRCKRFTSAIMFLWLFVFSFSFVHLVIFQSQNDVKAISAVGDAGVTDIYAYVGTYDFSSFSTSYGGSTGSALCIDTVKGSRWGLSLWETEGVLVVTAAPAGYKWKLLVGTSASGEGAGYIFEDSTINESVTREMTGNSIYSIEIQLVEVAPTTNEVSIDISITGSYKSETSGVILYLMKDNVVQSQIVANNNVPIKLTQKIGETFTILVSKPYMWTMTVSGDCTQDDDNKNKITYTVASTAQTITLEFSGGCASSMIAV